MLVRASSTAPAARMRSTVGESPSATVSFSVLHPWLVAYPATSRLILAVKGTPCNGPRGSSARTAASAASAAWRTSSRRTSTIALIRSFTSSMRARCASTTSREEVTP